MAKFKKLDSMNEYVLKINNSFRNLTVETHHLCKINT